ncbi:hypothetical protein RB653_002742 [Dictyostelium firmibasis]|uniref:Uncharacterized protein n=1 Tax=Dictyostelium firmibasis TaxID=79012 RepID=A0AAN7TR13_9MYCE
MINIELISNFKKVIGYDFNCVLVGEIFKSTNKHLLIGTVDGKIIVYLNDEEIEVLETKGSSIQQLELLDTTKFGSIDVISGDSNGNLVIFSNHQILYRDTINGSITSIITHKLSNNDFNIVVGDSLGLLTSIKPHQNTIWRYKIPSVNQTLNSLIDSDIIAINPDIKINYDTTTDAITTSLHIKDIKSVEGYDMFKNKFNYLVISENASFIHIVDQGKRLCSIPTPSPVNCMCVGYFDSTLSSLSPNASSTSSSSSSSSSSISLSPQIALGCENGFIYLLVDFKIYPYCQIGYPITKLNKMKYSDINDYDSNNINNNKNKTNDDDGDDNDDVIDDLDILICAGYFNSIKMYYNKKIICDHSLDDWCHTLSIGQVENSGDKTIVIGKLDNTIEYLKPKKLVNKEPVRLAL